MTSDLKVETRRNESVAIDSLKVSLRNNLRQYTMFIALIGLALIFTILTNGMFITARNLSNLFLQTAHIAVMACGVVLVIVAGHIDLSIGSVLGFTGAIAALLQVELRMGTVPTIIITLIVGMVVGIWQGYWIAYREVPAFIVTLAGMMIFKGALIGVTQGKTIAPMSNSFKAIGQSYIPNIVPGAGIHVTTLVIGIIVIILYNISELNRRKERKNYNFEVLSVKMQIVKMVAISAGIGLFFLIMVLYKGVPYSIIILLLIALIYSYIANKTTFGRHVFAIGGNKEAAKLSGINIRQRNMIIYVSMGILAALGGIIFTARLNAASAAAGNSMELEVIASAIIGGTSTMGGEGSIPGAIIGALVMSTLNNGMSLMNVGPTWQYIVKGLILLLAVWLDISSRKKA